VLDLAGVSSRGGPDRYQVANRLQTKALYFLLSIRERLPDVPEPLANHFRMYVVFEELGGMGVALVVEADAPNLKA
jgi:hypothetical protein